MDKKKILIYAHYYAPDVASTGQILQDLAEGMKDEFEVTVICTVPSYTGKIEERYKEKKFYKETINGVNVIRVPVPEFDKKNKISRIRNLIAYFIQSKKATKQIGNQDYVMTISQPPIMGGMLGVYGKRSLKNSKGESPKFIYCIQDFNPEQIEAVGYFKNKLVINMLRWIDNRSCKSSDLIITVGRDLVKTVENRFKGKNIPKAVMINNWIDEKQIYPLPSDNDGVLAFKKKYGLENQFIIMYSGNIGLYYDLENILKVIAEFKNAKTPKGEKVAFVFVGEGSILDKLVSYKNKNELENVVFLPYQPKDKLIYSLNAANVHWCVNAKGIKGVSCPSKFYGICGTGKPVLGVLENGSEVQMLINEIGCGLVSEPGDYQEVEKIIKWFIENSATDQLDKMGTKGYEYLADNLTKRKSIEKYISTIKNI